MADKTTDIQENVSDKKPVEKRKRVIKRRNADGKVVVVKRRRIRRPKAKATEEQPVQPEPEKEVPAADPPKLKVRKTIIRRTTKRRPKPKDGDVDAQAKKLNPEEQEETTKSTVASADAAAQAADTFKAKMTQRKAAEQQKVVDVGTTFIHCF